VEYDIVKDVAAQEAIVKAKCLDPFAALLPNVGRKRVHGQTLKFQIHFRAKLCVYQRLNNGVVDKVVPAENLFFTLGNGSDSTTSVP
jgi:hypothetical protein